MFDDGRRSFLKTGAAASFGLALGARAGSAAGSVASLELRPDWWDAADEPFRHTWEGIVNVDQFRWMVRRDMQDQLALARRELGARHVRAVGMLDDEMRVFAADPRGFRDPARKGPRVNWRIVDYVVDSLLERGVRPVFMTTFMPGEMASGEKTVFTTKSRVSPPRDLGQWGDLVRQGVAHQVERLGRDVVRGFYFEVWNEPNLRGFFDGDQEQFHALWTATYRAIKSVDPDLRVGGPSTARGEWLGEFLEHGRRSDCRPDYVITHVYNNDSASAPASPFEGIPQDQAAHSLHFASGVVRGARRLLDGLGFKGEVHWNEWGRSWHPYDELRETSYEAAFVAKTMAEVSQLADVFSYWCLSDIYDQMGYGAEEFHGNYGLLNLNGLRKASYHAFELLGRLGARRVKAPLAGGSRTTNGLVTRSDHGYEALFYACPEDPAATGRVEVSLALPPGDWRPALFRIGGGENDVLARWKGLGSPAYPSRAQLQSLRDSNALAEARDAVAREGGLARISFEQPGVALVELRRR